MLYTHPQCKADSAPVGMFPVLRAPFGEARVSSGGPPQRVGCAHITGCCNDDDDGGDIESGVGMREARGVRHTSREHSHGTWWRVHYTCVAMGRWGDGATMSRRLLKGVSGRARLACAGGEWLDVTRSMRGAEGGGGTFRFLF